MINELVIRDNDKGSLYRILLEAPVEDLNVIAQSITRASDWSLSATVHTVVREGAV